MSLQTRMESTFARQFADVLAKETSPELRHLRAAAFEHFTADGFPTIRLEDWKYTNTAALAGEDWEVRSLDVPFAGDADALANIVARFDLSRSGLTALNLAFANFIFVRIPKDTAVEAPIDLTFTGEEGTAIFPHVVVLAEAGSSATIIERYESTAKSFTNTAIQVIVEDNAHLTHYRVQKESADTYHYGVTEVSLARGSVYDSTNINLGGALSRHDIEVRFTAEGGEAFVDGLYMLGGTQHSDTHSIIDHRVPNCVSHQNYKGVLNDRSRAVFNGKVFVRADARGTDANQSNKNLLLSNDARVDTKPQLEIFNDDVKCSHGATVGQLEEEELFYLLTRGLPENLARNLLTYGFAEEIINKIAIDSIKTELDEFVLNRLKVRLEA